MRVNVYAAEITGRCEIIEKTAETGASFVGIRFYLESAPQLKPPLHPDDDSSGVTFWVQSNRKGYKPDDEQFLIDLLNNAVALLHGYRRKRADQRE